MSDFRISDNRIGLPDANKSASKIGLEKNKPTVKSTAEAPSESFVSSDASVVDSEIQIKDRFVKNINNKYDYAFRKTKMGQYFDKKVAEKSALVAQRVDATVVEDPGVIKISTDKLTVKKNKPELPDFVTSSPTFERYKKDYETGNMRIFQSSNGLDYEFELGSSSGASLRGVFKR